MSECPTCGDVFKSDRGVKLHHKRSHGKSLTLNTYECYICGDKFERQKSNVSDKPCCSKDCSYKKISKERDNRVQLSCDNCGDLFKRGKYKVNTNNNYCSVECSYNGRSKKITVTCLQCGEEINRSPSSISETNFCSDKCRGIYQRSDKPSSRRLGDWSKKRTLALERAGYVCEHPNCERTKCKNGSGLHVHHIIPNRLTNPEAHNLDNLIVLCKSHHDEIEPPKYLCS